MRPNSRINSILEEIKYLWLQNPDWRLGQLLYNVTGERTQAFDGAFHFEDDSLLKMLQDNRRPSVIDYPDHADMSVDERRDCDENGTNS